MKNIILSEYRDNKTSEKTKELIYDIIEALNLDESKILGYQMRITDELITGNINALYIHLVSKNLSILAREVYAYKKY